MDIKIDFPGGLRVDADLGGVVVQTDQPAPSGDGSAPTPFALFLASMGTCAGIFVLHFCKTRGIPTENIYIKQKMDHNPLTGLIQHVEFEIHVPDDFPEKYHPTLIKLANQCPVKKHMENPPTMASVVKVD